jgi:hypothetical protein
MQGKEPRKYFEPEVETKSERLGTQDLKSNGRHGVLIITPYLHRYLQ